MSEERFNTCRFRSDEEEEHGFGGTPCCGVVLTKGYFCHRLGIPNLHFKLCLKCKYYEKRLDIIEETEESGNI